MGANIQFENICIYANEPVADIRILYAPLQGTTIDSKLIPNVLDEFPILCIAAACAQGPTRITHATELRHKESDRIHAMAQGLTQLGIHNIEQADGLTIYGGKLRGGIIDSYNDHRIAMAFAIAGCLANAMVTILNCHTVRTSFPDFIQHCAKIQLPISETHEIINEI